MLHGSSVMHLTFCIRWPLVRYVDSLVNVVVPSAGLNPCHSPGGRKEGNA